MKLGITTSKEIGKIVKEKRKSLAITQLKLAALCNVGVRFIRDLERGKETCQLQKSLTIIKMLNLTLTIDKNE